MCVASAVQPDGGPRIKVPDDPYGPYDPLGPFGFEA